MQMSSLCPHHSRRSELSFGTVVGNGPLRSLLSLLAFTFLSVVDPAMAAYDIESDNVKKLIFEDCAAAGRLIEQLPDDASGATFAYLLRVIDLEVSTHPIAAPRLPHPGLYGDFGSDPMLGGEIVHFQDLQRESDARRCALSLLERFDALAVSALPVLLDIVDDESRFRSDPEYRRLMAMTLEKLKRRVLEHADWPIPYETVRALLDRLPMNQSSVTRQFLVDLGERIVDTLTSLIPVSDNPVRREVFEILVGIDSEGTMVGQRLLPLLGDPDDTVRESVLSYASRLPAVRRQVFVFAVDRLEDLAPRVRIAALHTLSKLAQLGLEPVPLGRDGTAKLLEAFTKGDAAKRRMLGPVFLSSLLDTSVVRQRLLPLASGAEGEDLKADSIMLMARVSQGDRELARLVRDCVKREKGFVRGVCLRSIPFIAGSIKEKFALLLGATEGKKPRDIVEKSDILSAVAEATAEISEQSGEAPPLSLVRLFTESLSIFTLAPSVQPLFQRSLAAPPELLVVARFGAAVEKDILKALALPEAPGRDRAAWIVGLMKEPKATLYKGLVGLLKDGDPAVRERAVWALMQHPRDSREFLVPALSWQPLYARVSAARILSSTAPSTPGVVPVLLEGIAVMPCVAVIDLVPRLRAISSDGNDAISQVLIGCLGRSGDFSRRDVVRLLLQGGRLSDGNRSLLLAAIRSKEFDGDLMLDVLRDSLDLGLPSGEVVTALLETLASPDEPRRIRSIELLGQLGISAHSARDPLVHIVERDTENYIVKVEAVVALSRIDPNAVDLKSFFSRTLRSPSKRGYAVGALRRMPSDLVIPLLGGLMHQERLQERMAAYDASGELGEFAQPLVSVLLERFDNSSGDEARSILRALLRIAPETSELDTIVVNVALGDLGGSTAFAGVEREVAAVLPRLLASRSDPRDREALLRLNSQLASVGE